MSRGRKKLKVRVVPKNPGIPEYHKRLKRAQSKLQFPMGLRKSFVEEKALFFTTCFSFLCDMNCLFNFKHLGIFLPIQIFNLSSLKNRKYFFQYSASKTIYKTLV